MSVRLGQDVGHKVGAGRSRHDDHLNEDEIFVTLKYCEEGCVEEAYVKKHV